jgi:hypothetical protein
MTSKNLEALLCDEYLASSVDESPFQEWKNRCPQNISIITTQGFEERSVGFIESFCNSGLKAASVVIGSHSKHLEANAKYAERFKAAASCVAKDYFFYVSIDNEGCWVKEAIDKSNSPCVVLDITGIGTRGLFEALDTIANCNKQVFIAYTEAMEYWPKHHDWIALKAELIDSSALPDAVDEKPWLFGYEHKVELIPGHDGYDSAGTERALVGFLTYKYARLAAVMSAEDYAAFLFIAGRPRLSANEWRYQALLDINRDIVKDRKIVEISTFGYRSALQRFSEIMLDEESFLQKYDVHLALMGSKLQDVACWVLSCLVPSITVLTAVPSIYYPEAFSDGIGEKWIFPLTSPNNI